MFNSQIHISLDDVLISRSRPNRPAPSTLSCEAYFEQRSVGEGMDGGCLISMINFLGLTMVGHPSWENVVFA